MIDLNVLEARGLGKRYGNQWALRDCTLALPAGRVVGLVGPNGAGKTTLLQLAVGMLAPSGGEIAVFGRDPRETKSVLPRIGFVAQDSPLYRSFDVADVDARTPPERELRRALGSGAPAQTGDPARA